MLEELKKYIKDQFAEEFAAQGHHLTGAAEESIEFKEDKKGTDVTIEVWGNKYIAYVDKGVKASEIKSPYAYPRIEGLTEFWKKRGLSGNEAKKAAYATATKHKKEGMPTQESYKFSSTGKRTEFTPEVIKDEGKLGSLISNEMYGIFEAKIDNMIQKTQKTL